MELREYMSNAIKGVVVALAVTLILTAILTMIMTFKSFDESTVNTIFVVFTSIGVVFGGVLASKIHGKKGWLVGLTVGMIFYIVLYGVGILFGADATLNLHVFLKFVLCALAGLLSGMLGINLKRE